MRYITIITSNDKNNGLPIIKLRSDTGIIEHVRKVPGGGEQPNFLTGFIENRSLDFSMSVTFMTNRREAQTLQLGAGVRLKVTHQPCDDLIVKKGINETMDYALFKYSFKVIKGDTEEETKQLLIQTQHNEEQLDFALVSPFTRAAVFSGNFDGGDDTIFDVQAFDEIIVSRVTVTLVINSSGTAQPNPKDAWFELNWWDPFQPIRMVSLYGTDQEGSVGAFNSDFTFDPPTHQKRRINEIMQLRMFNNQLGFGLSDYNIQYHLEYAFAHEGV